MARLTRPPSTCTSWLLNIYRTPCASSSITTTTTTTTTISTMESSVSYCFLCVCRRNSQIPLPLQLLFGGCSTKRSFYKCLIWWWMTFFFSSILQVPKNAEASASIGCITINPLPPCPFHPLIHPPPPSKDLWSFPLWAGILLRKSCSFPSPRGI